MYQTYKNKVMENVNDFEVMLLQARTYYALRDFEKSERAFVYLFDSFN